MKTSKSPNSKVKNALMGYFTLHPWLKGRLVSCRLYNSKTDMIRENFSDEEWGKIFTMDVNDTILAELAELSHRVIIVGCNNSDLSVVGFMCIEAIEAPDLLATFHGGFWKHDIKHTLMLYESTHMCIDMMLECGINVETQCYINNIKADRFQKSLGFDEYYRDKLLSYKTLNIDKFRNNVFTKFANRKKL